MISTRELQKIYRKANKKYPVGYGKRLVMIAEELKGIGISDERNYFYEMLMEIGDYVVTANRTLVSDNTLKRLANARFMFYLDNKHSSVYFYTSSGDRVDPSLEELLKFALESLF